MKQYFRRSIADKLLLAPPEDRIDEGVFFPLEHLHGGVIAADILAGIPDDFSRVWIAPVICALLPEQGFAPATWPKWVSPLWFSAVLDKQSGVISFVPDRTPWIPRENLLPVKLDRFTWGTLSAWEKYIATHPFPSSWESGMEWARGCVENVTGQSLDDFACDGYRKLPHAVMVPASHDESSLLSLLRTADASLLNTNNKQSVMASIYSREAPSINELRKHSVWDGLKQHVAHAPGLPPLNGEQSESLRALLANRHNKINILDAPDGTGKSHLLLHWLANQWSHAAIMGETHPNILIVGDSDTQTHLSELTGTSNSIGRWCFSDLGWISPFSDDYCVEADTIQHGLTHYLDNAKAFFNDEALDLEGAVNRVHEALMQLSDALQEIPALMLLREELDEKKKQIVHTSHGLSNHFPVLCHEAKKILEQRKQAWRVFSHLHEEWKKHVESTPFWMAWTGGFPLTKQKHLERNKRFFSRFKIIPKDIVLDDNQQISQTLSKILMDVRRLVHDSQKTVDRIKSVEDGETKWHERTKALSGDQRHTSLYMGADGQPSPAWEKANLQDRCAILTWSVRYHEGVWLQHHRDDANASIATLFPAVFRSVEGLDAIKTQPDTVWIHDYDRVPSIFTAVLSGVTQRMVAAGDMTLSPPVLELPESIDMNNALHCHLLQHESDFNNFRKSNLSVVSGDFMKRAKKITASPSVLNTDYVHNPDIVSVLSQVTYQSGLVPPEFSERKSWDRFAFGWRHITDNGDPDRLPQTIAAWFACYAGELALDPQCVTFMTTSSLMSQKIKRVLAGTDFSASAVRSVFDARPRKKSDLVVFVIENNLMENGFSIYEKRPDLWACVLGQATQSVWFMGDMNGWSNHCNTAIGVISHALFRSQDHMLPEVPLPAWTHRRDLSPESFVIDDWKQFWPQWSADQDASMVLASPLITPEGVKATGFFEFAKSMEEMGVSISLYVNKNLCDQYAGEYLPEFTEACRKHHVSVFWKNALMDSMMWMDDSLVELSGSFLGSSGSIHALYLQGNTHEWRRQHIASWDSPQF